MKKCKQAMRHNRNAQRAFVFMLKANTKTSRTFWRNAWLYYTYQSWRAWQ